MYHLQVNCVKDDHATHDRVCHETTSPCHASGRNSEKLRQQVECQLSDLLAKGNLEVTRSGNFTSNSAGTIRALIEAHNHFKDSQGAVVFHTPMTQPRVFSVHDHRGLSMAARRRYLRRICG